MPGITIPSITPKRQSVTIDASNNIVQSAEGAQSAAMHVTSTSSLAGVWEGTMTDINAIVNNSAVGESGADWFDLPSIQINDTGITEYAPLASVTPTDDDVLVASTLGALFVRFRRTAGSGTVDCWVSNLSIQDIQIAGGAGVGDATAANQATMITSLQAIDNLAVGATPYSLLSAASTNLTSVATGARTIYSIQASNTNVAPRYLKIYDKASAPDPATDTPKFRYLIPGNTSGAGTNISVSVGSAFTLGIAFLLVTGPTDTNADAVGVAEIMVNLQYK